jgi:hypothetical protein
VPLSLRPAQKSKEASVELEPRNSNTPWASRWGSRWIPHNNKASSRAFHSKAPPALPVHRLAAIRRLHYGIDPRSTHAWRGNDKADFASRMGELEPWIDENFVRTVWFGMGYQVNVKMIRDKFSGFVRFFFFF